MKLTYLILGIITMSLCSSCYRPDDSYEEPPIFEIKKDDMVSIENNTTLFNIGDTIIINSVVENTQTTTDGQIINLDEYYTEGKSKVVMHRLTLLKALNCCDLTVAPIKDEDIESIEGERSSNGDVTGTLKDGVYKTKFGIKLKEAGTYYLSPGGVLVFLGGNREKGSIYIYSNIKNSEGSGMYKFTVK